MRTLGTGALQKVCRTTDTIINISSEFSHIILGSRATAGQLVLLQLYVSPAFQSPGLDTWEGYSACSQTEGSRSGSAWGLEKHVRSGNNY